MVPALPLAVLAYLAGGLGVTLLQQQLSLSGAGEPATLLAILPNYASCLLVHLLAGSRATPLRVLLGRLGRFNFVSLFLDIVATMLAVMGIELAGSGPAAVLSSSGVVWSAIFGVALLGRQLRAAQWLAIAAVFIGLGMTGSSAAEQDSGVALGGSGTRAGGLNLRVLLGVGASLLSAVLFASENTLIDAYSKRHASGSGSDGGPAALQAEEPVKRWALLRWATDAPRQSALDQCALMGVTGVCAFVFYSLVYTLPNRERLLYSQLRTTGGNVLALLALQTLAATFVNAGYFVILERSSALVLGLLIALRSIGVLLASAWLFCPALASQCLNATRVAASLVVLTGLAGFSIAK
jgi:drug/metabolite transporter (DMT)-like permease